MARMNDPLSRSGLEGGAIEMARRNDCMNLHTSTSASW